MAEICGFIGFDGKEFLFKQMHNHNPEPNKYFSISPLDYLKFKNEYIFVAVFHSHINSGCEPSEFDLANSKNCALPFLVYSIPENKFHLHVPENSEVNENLLEEFGKLL
jgi:proteasome lid subunit RPN8/RPN11